MMASQFENRRLSRTALSLFAVGAILLAAGIYGAWRVHRLHKRGTDILSDNVASIRAAERLEMIALETKHRLKRHLSSGNDRHLEDVDELLPQCLDALEEVEARAKSRREQQLSRRIREELDRFHSEFELLASEPSSIVRRETILGLADHLIPNRVLANTEKYIALNEESIDQNKDRNQSTANRLMFGLLLLGTCGGVAGLIAGYGIAHLVDRTIVQLAIPIRDTAGKLSQITGPVAWAAKPGFDDLESILKSVSSHVTTVIERLQESEHDRLRAEQLAAVGQLAAGLAHELRNPLTSMKAILQIACAPNQLSKRDLEVLRDETSRLERTVQSLLDYTRPPQPQKVATEIHRLLGETVSLVERRCQRKGITLNFVPTHTELTIVADEAQLRQLVLNLLLNAVDVTPRGGNVLVECQLDLQPMYSDQPATQSSNRPVGNRNDPHFVLRVSDTGPGLPRGLEDRIFDPFVTTKATGTGLGLSICRQIARGHEATIVARNSSGGGAIFELRLPINPATIFRSSTQLCFDREDSLHVTDRCDCSNDLISPSEKSNATHTHCGR